MANRKTRPKAKRVEPVDVQRRVEDIVEHGNALLRESAGVATLLQPFGRIIAQPGGENLIRQLSALAEESAERFAVWAEFVEFERRRIDEGRA